MSHPTRFGLLPAFLFRLTLAASGVLILLVLLAPPADNRLPGGTGWRRLVTLFAQDPTVRRTALASAVGLAATGCIFFRVPGSLRPTPRAPRPPKAPTPPPIVGA